MKVLFVVRRITIAGEPMGIMLLSAIARRRGWESRVAVSPDALKAVADEAPDLVAVSCMSGDYSDLKDTIAQLRQSHPGLPILLGGPHTTFVPDAIDEVEADAVCIGEGEDAFAEVLERLERGVRDFSGILNIQTKTERTAIRPLITDLDALPFIDRDLVYRNSDWKHFKLRSFYTSRGCPYSCAYCFNHGYRRVYHGLGPTYRKRSVDNVIEEILEVTAQYPTEYIRFSDDVFIVRHDEWIEEFAEKYSRKVGIPFYCLIKSDIITPELVAVLKKAGCASVCMSIETANEELRSQVLSRKGQNNEQMLRSFDLFNEAGINIYTNSMIGLPHSTIKDELDTIELYLKAKPKCGLFTICVPYPGTELFSYCVKNGLVRADLTHEEINRTSGDYSMLDSFSAKEKEVQKNISLLGTVAVTFPWLKDLITKRLIYLPNNKLFFLIYFLVKNYQFSKYIVPIRYSASDYLRLGFAALKNDAVMFITGKGKNK
ncbi:B12-binding domain-containing radical SAM protein [Geomonas paludis]|uniref:B12-binding domain-containing radical SAM protein n=1 Tax=Geomonas paludis TaxID=2740185 RepID=A0A6V8MZW3_9BACT|nr:radical SAM protein [Geomonas paludis]GFO65334.1 B12-binding domain-containing radical SAM protein [Geomonas paludis]